MLCRQIIPALTMALLGCVTTLYADEVRYYDQGGVTYRETRHVIQRPVLDTQIRETTQTFYRETYTTQIRESVRERWTPVTDYRLETYWVGRWNPFVQPYQAQRYVPYTRWEKATEVVKTPVACRQLVPETRTVRVPVTTQRLVDEEVITRVAVAGRPSPEVPWTTPSTTSPPSMGLASSAAASPSTAGRLVPVPESPPATVTPGPIGGMARLESDPPRQGWRACRAARWSNDPRSRGTSSRQLHAEREEYVSSNSVAWASTAGPESATACRAGAAACPPSTAW